MFAIFSFLECCIHMAMSALPLKGCKGPVVRAISPGPPFHGLKIHFYSTNLQLLVMFPLYDIFMSWAQTENRLIFRPCDSDFLLTTTSFIPSWIMINEMDVSWFSGHLKLFRLHIPWQLAVVIYGVRRFRFKCKLIWSVNSDANNILIT